MGAESPSPLSSPPSVIQCPHQRPHLTPSPCLTHVPLFVLIVGAWMVGTRLHPSARPPCLLTVPLSSTLQHVHLVCSLCLSPPPFSHRPPCLLTVPLSSTLQHVHLVCSQCPLSSTLQHVHLVCSLCLSPPPFSTSTLSAHSASLLHPSARPPCLLTVPLSSTLQHVHLVCSLCLSPPPVSTSSLSLFTFALCSTLQHVHLVCSQCLSSSTLQQRPPCLLTVPLSSTLQHVHLVCSQCLSLLHPSARHHLVCSLCRSPPPFSTSTLSAHSASLLLHPSARPPCLLTVPLSPPPFSTSTLSAHSASLSSTLQHVHLVCSLCRSPPPFGTSTLSLHKACARLGRTRVSVQFTLFQDGIYALGKVHLRPTPSLRRFPTLPLKRFQCSSDWRWPSLVLYCVSNVAPPPPPPPISSLGRTK